MCTVEDRVRMYHVSQTFSSNGNRVCFNREIRRSRIDGMFSNTGLQSQSNSQNNSIEVLEVYNGNREKSIKKVQMGVRESYWIFNKNPLI